MSSSPKVSIIIPTYNRSYLLSRTLESVKAQTFQHWECVIVDDGSNDATIRIIRKFIRDEQRMSLVFRERMPKGAPTCRNIGIEHAKGKYVLFLDSDDILAPFCLQQRVRVFEREGMNDFLVFNCLVFKDETEKMYYYWNVKTHESDLLRFVRMDAVWQTSGPIYKKKYLERMPGFNEELKFWQDYELHMRYIISGAKYQNYMHGIPDVYIRYFGRDSISRSTPFAAEINILQERITFCHRIYDLLMTSGSKNSHEIIYTCQSVIYNLCVQLLTRHSKLMRFIIEWTKICKYHDGKKIFLYGIIYAMLIKLKIDKNNAGVRRLCKDMIDRRTLPDYEVFKKTRLAKVKYRSGAAEDDETRPIVEMGKTN